MSTDHRYTAPFFLQRSQKIQRPGRILRPFFQQGDQAADGLLDLFRGGGDKGIVQLYGKDDQHDLGQGGRIRKMDLSAFDTLADDLCKHWLQLCDQVGQEFLMDKRTFYRIQMSRVAVFF